MLGRGEFVVEQYLVDNIFVVAAGKSIDRTVRGIGNDQAPLCKRL